MIPALETKAAGEGRVILSDISGHGLLDLEGFSSDLAGRLTDS